ncbi:MAG TPA: choice-of-anchor tandem repeat GloVer-containing protein [Terriglobia bacterium]|nr:choice-of-anchor tandem repeat GloVer-containing protein [Terriglobia bacterium]
MDKRYWMKRVFGLLLLCATAAIPLPAQTFETLHSFDKTDGAFPLAGLVQATNGNLYGTTAGGGSSSTCSFGCGTIFKITPGGTVTTLYSFCSVSSCADGRNPVAPLVQATDGNFYGTTEFEGANDNGTVFKITSSGTLTTLHSFDSTDGSQIVAGLIQGTDGNFYGTTEFGGANNSNACSNLGCGTVFKITRGGKLTTLYNFCSQSGCADGTEPMAGLVQATDGNFYGTTGNGGANSGGTVFKLAPTGALVTLYSFCSQSGCADGGAPEGLIQATDGNFYGTARGGGNGTGDGAGTVFQITPSGALTTLYRFCSQINCDDGQFPVAGLIQATDGNFYGATSLGGTTGVGTVFKVTIGGTLTTLHSFCPQRGCTDGRSPVALVQDTGGNFYGTTGGGGANGDGTVFSLSVGLGPFVKPQTTSGKVGASVKILGTNLTGATSVTFNGTAATFTVVSPSLITTTVPTGATTGTVQVVTPSGTLSSNVPFRVLP